MPANRTVLIMLLLAVLLPGCVEPFTPDLKEGGTSMVVEAVLTDWSGDQHIYISKASSFYDPERIPEQGCLVWVTDDQGNVYDFTEDDPGAYTCVMEASQLKSGIAYRLIIQTADEREYESELVYLSNPSPPVDSVYYERKNLQTEDPKKPLQGIQFYLDLDAEEYGPNNYYWELIETWEYHAAHRIQYYYFDSTLFAMPNPDELFVCWHTKRVRSIHTASTKQLVSNSLTRQPLNFVSDETNRLRFKYSLLVRQHTLNDIAFEYWDQLRSQSEESGGLYEKQPSQLNGNIRNINDPDEQVLGFFNISSVSEKRIFASNVLGLDFPPVFCRLDTVDSITAFPSLVNKPIYMFSIGPLQMGPPYVYGFGMCFDCTADGGTTVRPDFWE